MSLAAATPHPSADMRAALVAALDSIDGLTGYPVAPDQATDGAAWPKWVQSVYSGRLCDTRLDTWEVYAVLPGSYAPTTADQGDALRDLVAPVLGRFGPIDYAEPVAIAFNDNQSMPGLRFRLHT